MAIEQKITAKSNKLFDNTDLLFVWTLLKKNILLLIFIPIISFLTGYIYTYRLVEVYGAKSQLLLQSNETYDYQDPIYKGLGAYGAYRDVRNQMRILESYEIVGEAVDRIDCNVAYFVVGRINKKEVFGTLPFTANCIVLNPTLHEKPVGVKILSEDEFELNYFSGNTQMIAKGSFGKEFLNNDFQLTLERSFPYNESNFNRISEPSYELVFHSDDYLIKKLKSNTDVINIEHTSILEITVQDELPGRAKIFLDTLAQVFSEFSVKNQIEINTNTLANIEKQIYEVKVILDSLENEIILFKNENSIIHVTKEENEYFTKYVEFTQEGRLLNEKLNSVLSLKQYISSSIDEHTLPPSLFILNEDEYLNETIIKLYELQLEASDQMTGQTVGNPNYENKMKKIGELRKDLLIYSNNLLEALKTKILANNQITAEYKTKMKSLPISASGLENLQRELEVNNQMYLFLLERRINTLIARAGIIPQAKTIENAATIGVVFPNKGRIKTLFAIAGLILAFLIAIIRKLFFEKIVTPNELKNATSLSFIGSLPYFKSLSDELILKMGPKSLMAESLRGIRTNINFLNVNNNKSQIILFSSFYPGEGKTFTSVNLADLLSRSNKKVLLLDFDLHKPRVHKMLGLSNDSGLSEFIVGGKKINDVLIKLSDNFHILNTGSLAPNPSELILGDKVNELLEYGRSNYDFVIIDTPPFGLINDAVILSEKVDSFIVVSNTRALTKRGVGVIEEMLDKIDKPKGIILNGVRQSKFQYYYAKYTYKLGYSYGYKYGYGGAYGSGYDAYISDE